MEMDKVYNGAITPVSGSKDLMVNKENNV